MTGRDLKLSGTRADFGQFGNPVVLLEFTGHGSNQFQKITKEEATRGEIRFNTAGRQGDYKNYAQHFAIVLDGQLESTPYIDFKQNPNGIPGPNAEIDLGNGGTIKEAKDLALILQTGALPVSFQQIERTDVSSTLGKDSLTQAWHAALVGLDPRRDLPARPLPLPRPRRGRSASRSTRSSTTRRCSSSA